MPTCVVEVAFLDNSVAIQRPPTPAPKEMAGTTKMRHLLPWRTSRNGRFRNA